MYFCYASLSVILPVASLSIFVVLTKVLTLIVITPGNMGIREFAYAFLARSMNVGEAEGLSTSIILRVINFSVFGILGAILLLFEHRKKQKIKGHNSIAPNN
jgi:uncharacterized protein (TIRG00374 family)